MEKKKENSPVCGIDLKDGIPNHAQFGNIFKCCNSRMSECAYAIDIEVDTEAVYVNKKFCLWKYKKEV